MYSTLAYGLTVIPHLKHILYTWRDVQYAKIFPSFRDIVYLYLFTVMRVKLMKKNPTQCRLVFFFFFFPNFVLEIIRQVGWLDKSIRNHLDDYTNQQA